VLTSFQILGPVTVVDPCGVDLTPRSAHRRTLLAAVVVAGLAGTVGYLWLAAQRVDPQERPRPHFYVLAGLAFLCWALGTNAAVSALIHVDQQTGAVALGLAVFLIPMLDEILLRLRD
jgi:hypothetical protein